MDHIITQERIAAFRLHLCHEERSENTIAKYLHDLNALSRWLAQEPVSKERLTGWKEHLLASGRSPVTVNAALAAAHSFLAFAGWGECRVKYLKRQRRAFRDSSRDLSREEFTRLVDRAQGQGRKRLALVLQTICATGIRVSELSFITVEAANRGRAEVNLKGKIRTILIPGRLARKLQKYAQKQKIASGEIFLTEGGRPLSRGQIWREMKKLCAGAGVDATKVFPHNLRHLFARTFYKASRDIVRLADVLGHSSVDTTRIYLITTGEEYARQLDSLGLVL